MRTFKCRYGKIGLSEFEIIVASSLTAAADEEIHQKSLDVMKGLFIKVL